MGVFNVMKTASGGASLANLVKREVETLLRDRLGALLQEQNQFVTRDEFEAVKIMAENALQQNEKLRIKIAELEKKKNK
ncbi:MAG: accessory factor UbiK family protein [Alphaproteobacteria bacterium]|nr:accessory factor UbiK family protein [Alphaproteobacteria bacterium]